MWGAQHHRHRAPLQYAKAAPRPRTGRRNTPTPATVQPETG
jgi:hypothetical protein